MTTSKTHILKFGGSSLQSQANIRQAAQITATRQKEARIVTVVSAIGNVTDTLTELTEQPKRSSELIDELEQHHLDLYDQFASPKNGQTSLLHELFSELQQVADNDNWRKSNYEAWKDQILSFGERASSIIFSAALSAESISAQPITAHNIIKTDSRFNEARVHQDESIRRIRHELAQLSPLPVVTGFIGSDAEGNITTLGRSGSDYTAGIIAEALQADRLEIWTDVDGVLSADPRWVPTATSVETLNFDDIEELSAHGANVIHPKTIQPIQSASTSVVVKNSHNPSHPGTTINRDFQSNGSFKTVTVTGPFVLVKVDDQHTLDLAGKLNKLSANKHDTFTFKQHSSYEPARFLIDQSFFNRHESDLWKWTGQNDAFLNVEKDLYRVKKFSNHFGSGKQLMTRIWNLLTNRDLQPLHIERNSDERFVSLLFNKDEARRAARLFDTCLHQDKKVVDIFIAGNGAVGNTLLRQFRNLNEQKC